MKAVVATGDHDLVRLEPIPRPVPVVVDVSAISVNRGELHLLIMAMNTVRDVLGSTAQRDAMARRCRR